MHPDDQHDALTWAVNQLKFRAPQGGHDQLDRNRMHVLEQMRDAALREARK